MSNQKPNELERKKLLLEQFAVYEKVKAEGFAGILPNGNIVDRREYPNAIPLQKNSLLNIPEPKELPNSFIYDAPLTC